MIAELAAFNAAFGVVKAAISNGRDIASCAKQIGDMIGAEEELQKRGTKKRNSIWSTLAGKDSNDFEEFMALEKIKEQRKELLSSMQLYGRAGLKDDFLKFEIEARKARRQAVGAHRQPTHGQDAKASLRSLERLPPTRVNDSSVGRV